MTEKQLLTYQLRNFWCICGILIVIVICFNAVVVDAGCYSCPDGCCGEGTTREYCCGCQACGATEFGEFCCGEEKKLYCCNLEQKKKNMAVSRNRTGMRRRQILYPVFFPVMVLMICVASCLYVVKNRHRWSWAWFPIARPIGGQQQGNRNQSQSTERIPMGSTRSRNMYVNIMGKEGTLEIPVEKNKGIPLSEFQVFFPTAVGLKYETEQGKFRVIPVTDASLYPPQDGWGNRLYIAMYPATSVAFGGAAEHYDEPPPPYPGLGATAEPEHISRVPGTCDEQPPTYQP